MPCRGGTCRQGQILARHGGMLQLLTDLAVLPGEARGAVAAADGAVGTAGPAVQAGVVLAGVGRSCGVGVGTLSRDGGAHRSTHPFPTGTQGLGLPRRCRLLHTNRGAFSAWPWLYSLNIFVAFVRAAAGQRVPHVPCQQPPLQLLLLATANIKYLRGCFPSSC